jgi:hypothetical protein
VAAGAYSDDEARTYLGQLDEARRQAGRSNVPFDIFLSLWSPPDAGLYRRFEEEHGVTDILCAPAMLAKVDPADPPEKQLRTRLDTSARFADQILSKMP